MRNYGGVDLLCANAGGPPPGKFANFEDAQWRNAFELTLMGTVRMIRAVIPHMKRRGGGSILAITSTSVKEPVENLLLSNVFRSGVTALLKSLSVELAPDNIRVNNIMPGKIDTDRIKSFDSANAEKTGDSIENARKKNESTVPMGRYGTADEFGNMAAFLLSPAASYITGESVQVDGGLVKTVW